MKINVNEALRYAGMRENTDPNLESLMDQTARQMEQDLQPKTCWKVYDLIPVDYQQQDIHQDLLEDQLPNPQQELKTCGWRLKGTDVVLSGKTAFAMLADCQKVVVCAGTLGLRFEQMLNLHSVLNMTNALFYDACGSAAIESVMNELEEEVKNKLPGWYLTDRFSCGYGDLPLSLQKDFANLLDLKKIGIFVQPSMMMVPSKSVTALIGLSKKEQPAKVRGCEVCSFAGQCQLKKEGKNCGI